MKSRRYFSIAALLLLTQAAFGQGHGGIICCNQLIDVGGDWVTADRNRCIDYMNESTSSRAKVCAHLIRGECAASSVDAGRPVADSLLALLLPSMAHAQGCVNSAGTPVGCGPTLDLSKMSPAAPTPMVCCPEAAALCEESSCKDDPASKGFVFASRPGTNIRSEPAASAPSVGVPPSGTRFLYTEFRRIGGQTWFYVENPGGGRKGWLSGEDAGCKRPSALPPRRPIKITPSDIPLAVPSSAQGGARG
jgi:SH3 domain-containing protein